MDLNLPRPCTAKGAWQVSVICIYLIQVIEGTGAHVYYYYYYFFKPLWPCGPTRAMSTSFTRFLDHTQRPTTVTTPLDEWSTRHSDFYLTAQNTHNKHPFPRRDSNPQSQQASRRRPTP